MELSEIFAPTAEGKEAVIAALGDHPHTQISMGNGGARFSGFGDLAKETASSVQELVQSGLQIGIR